MENGAWPSGKATGFGPAIRRFESFRPRAYLFMMYIILEYRLYLIIQLKGTLPFFEKKNYHFSTLQIIKRVEKILLEYQVHFHLCLYFEKGFHYI